VSVPPGTPYNSPKLAFMVALAAQIDAQLSPLLPNIQAVGGAIWNPTPPCIDMLPDDPFEELIAFSGKKATHLVLRARTDTPDREGAQELLIALMDSESDVSLEQAVLFDDTLGGIVEQITVESGPSEFGAFVDPGGTALLGCTWRLQVLRA